MPTSTARIKSGHTAAAVLIIIIIAISIWTMMIITYTVLPAVRCICAMNAFFLANALCFCDLSD